MDVLDEIWDLIESVSEGFLTYSWMWDLIVVICDHLVLFTFRLTDGASEQTKRKLPK